MLCAGCSTRWRPTRRHDIRDTDIDRKRELCFCGGMGEVNTETRGPEVATDVNRLVLIKHNTELRRLALAIERKARVVRDDCERFERSLTATT